MGTPYRNLIMASCENPHAIQVRFQIMEIIHLSQQQSLRESTPQQITQKQSSPTLTLREGAAAVSPLEEADRTSVVIPRSVRRLLEDPSSLIDQDGCCLLEPRSVLIGRCNGLVCFCVFSRIGECRVRIWNPATALWWENSPNVDVGCVSFGFGYDHSTNAYKVVGLRNYCSGVGLAFDTKIYCIGDSSWREIPSNPGFPFSPMNNGLFVGGCVNWLVVDNTRMQLVITSFDMSEEAYRSLSFPEGASDSGAFHSRTNLGTMGSCLCLFQDHEKTHFVVWQMREYGVRESWTQLLSVSYEHLQCDGFTHSLLLMCSCEDDDILMAVKYQDDYVIMYNPRDNSVKHVQPRANKRLLNVNAYVQSLVSPY